MSADEMVDDTYELLSVARQLSAMVACARIVKDYLHPVHNVSLLSRSCGSWRLLTP
jgi:hypothetical protein